MGTIFKHVRMLFPNGDVVRGDVKCEGDKIYELSDDIKVTPDDLLIEGNDLYLSPGFIDLHTHGGGGYDFMDGTKEAFLCAAEMHARHGTTALLPTTLTSTDKVLQETFEVYKEAKRMNHNGSLFLGLHLEGPYFAYNQRGAQDPKYLRKPSPQEYNQILEASDDIVRWSIAPELDGALELGRELRKRKILPSVAHSDATYEEVAEAFEAGFTHITHLYSCTSSVTRRNGYRYAGIVEAAYLIDEMTVEIIADGVHLPASLLQLVYKIKGSDRIALITDSMRGAGMPDGPSILGSQHNGQKVLIEEGGAKLPDRSAFAGSVATADRLVRNMIKLAKVPLPDAVKMMTQTPARIIGVEHKKGSLEVGKDADLILFDDDVTICLTMIEGRVVYNSL